MTLSESNEPTKPSPSTPKATIAGMPIVYYAYLEPKTFEETFPVRVVLDELSRTVFIDLRSFSPWPFWMGRLVIRYGRETHEAIDLEVSETGQLSLLSSMQELTISLLPVSSKPNP